MTAQASLKGEKLRAEWLAVSQDVDGNTVLPDHYTFSLDGAPPVDVPPGVTSQTFVIQNKGPHTISVAAVNALGQSSAPATFTFAAVPPKNPTGVTVKKP